MRSMQVCAAFGAVMLVSAAFASPAEVFRAAEAPLEIAGGEPGREVMRSSFTTVDVGSLLGMSRGSSIALEAFPDLSVELEATRLDPGWASDFVWHGRVAGDDESTVFIAVKENVARGEIFWRGGHLTLRYAGDGVHEIQQIDGTQFDGCATGPAQAVFGQVGEQAARGGAGDDGSIIDVLVAYTPNARLAEGGENAILALIDASAAGTNTAYANSNVTQRIRVVETMEVNYTESASFSTDLDRLRGTSDGFMDEVHGVRNNFGADLVALISTTNGACGIGYLMTTVNTGFASSGFTVTRYSCASGNLTFAHELGHNMGCAHDRDNAFGGAFCYSFGHRTPNNQFRTVMAYAPGSRRAYFSNPNVTFSGFPMGVDGDCNDEPNYNALSLDNTAPVVALFRESVIPLDGPGSFSLVTPADEAEGFPPSGRLRWQSSALAESYDVIISEQTDLSNPVAEISGVFGTQADVPPGSLDSLTTYYWSVTAVGNGGETDTASGIWSFTTAVLGDVNGDQVVDFTDLNTLLTQFGLVGPGLSADVNGDGVVNFSDLNIVLSNFGGA